jgi:hypothetical protein
MRAIPTLLLPAIAVRAATASPTRGQGVGYLERPLTLPHGQGRIGMGPPDYGYMAHGVLNNGRGLTLSAPSEADTSVRFGAGDAINIDCINVIFAANFYLN